MKKLMSNIAKFTVVPTLLLSFSVSSFASSNHMNELQQALAAGQHKSQFLFISQKLNELKLPKELALIPVIESHYNSNAVSNKGAGGLWQLMPATAKEYGINSQARFQVEPSTVAALQYFKSLHQQFGNWEFAIAAYNAGGGRVSKALHNNPTATSVQQLNLPKETKEYVQKFYEMEGELKSVEI